MWQDYVFAIGSIGFIVALWPTVWRVGEKPAIFTSLMTWLILLAFSVTQASLHLWFASVTTLILAWEWFVLVIQARQTKNWEGIE